MKFVIVLQVLFLYGEGNEICKVFFSGLWQIKSVMILSFSIGSDGSSFNSSVADQQVGLTFLSHPLEDTVVFSCAVFVRPSSFLNNVIWEVYDIGMYFI